MRHNPEFVKLVERVKERVVETTVEEVKRQMDRRDPIFLIDVREDHEYLDGYARGAIHLGRGILERDIEDRIPDKQAPIVLYCGGGYRSALAAANLLEMGYAQVRSMAGGFKAWKAAGYPVLNESP